MPQYLQSLSFYLSSQQSVLCLKKKTSLLHTAIILLTLFNKKCCCFIFQSILSHPLGGATSVIRWRYKTDYKGDVELDNDGQPIKESNARLVKLKNGTYKLLVGDATFHTSIHKTEKRCDHCFLSFCSLSILLSSLYFSMSLYIFIGPLIL